MQLNQNMAKEKEKIKFDFYLALAEILDRLNAYYPEYKVKIFPGKNNKYHDVFIDHQDGYIHQTSVWKEPRPNDDFDDYTQRIFETIVSSNDFYLKKKKHLESGVHPAEFSKEAVSRIKKLAKKVFGEEYGGIDILDSQYSNSMFTNYIVALARTPGLLRSKKEPLIYIPLYEFFTVTLFERIYSADWFESEEPDPELANEWVEINMSLMNTFQL